MSAASNSIEGKPNTVVIFDFSKHSCKLLKPQETTSSTNKASFASKDNCKCNNGALAFNHKYIMTMKGEE